MYKKSIKSYNYISIILLLAISMFAGCAANKPQPPNPPTYSPAPVGPPANIQTQPPEPVNEKIEGYLPLKLGNKWVYEGQGADMASYTQEVTYNKDNRYQIRTDAAGIISTNIFEVREDSIANVYLNPGDSKNILNQADIADIIFLKLPIAVGTTWISEQNTYEIIQTDAKVTVPYGTIDNCVVVRLSFYDGSTKLLYYKKGIGLVLSEFTTNRETITSKLKSFISK